jgi:hypothetical protein
MIVCPIILILLLIIVTSFEKKINIYVFFASIFIIGISIVLYFFLKTNISKYIFNIYLLYLTLGLLTIVGLSIIFTLFSGILRKLNGWTGFFVNLLFYIPCLLRDLVKELINEYNNSSMTLFILFIIEILLIIMYFLIIPLINDKAFPEKIIVLEDPVMINKKMDLKNILCEKTNYDCGVSMWIYLNSMPNSKFSYTKETTIFEYSNSRDSKKPHIKIVYFNNEYGSNDFIIYMNSEKFNISLPLQRWNNFVINFVSYEDILSDKEKEETSPDKKEEVIKYTTDIFINGVLEKTYTYENYEKPLFEYTDSIIVGDESENDNFQGDGLYGSICNIVFYKKPLSQLAIVYNYNLLSIKNPPISY